jgi:omega-hydroxy-beta-dihydromenaquinone-9 sulfotransferase
MEREPTWKFTPKHHWSVKNHMLSGICFLAWVKMLWRLREDVDWFCYWHRLLFLTLMSLFNSLLALPDWILYSSAIQKEHINPRPVFILGHPRTGTTHLHNLLSLDTEQFIFSNTFQVGFPSSFLCNEALGSRLLAPILDDTRPMDNMALSFKIPQEDELAHNVLSSGCSPYMPLVFPASHKRFRPFFTFEDGCSKADFESWADSFTFFFKKVWTWL